MFKPMFNSPLAAFLAISFGLFGCTMNEGSAPMILEEPMIALTASPGPAAQQTIPSASNDPLRGAGGSPRAGVVTAGDIDDTLNLARFQRYQARASAEFDLPKIDAQTPVRLRFTGPAGQGAPGVTVTLRRPGSNDPFFQGVSGVDGRLLVLPQLHGEQRLTSVEVRAFQEDREVARRVMPTGLREQQFVVSSEADWAPAFLDLVFVIDTSGSMGDEHAWLAREFAGIVRQAKRAAPGIDIRYGLIAYRSPGDNYILRNYGFTRRQAHATRWIESLDATGGQGGPEVADRALRAAAEMPWRRGRGERLVFLVGDEPPAPDLSDDFLEAAALASRKNVQVYTLGASDILGDTEFLMRQASVATGGRYLFLTDDSGVGRAHAEPNIPCYRVTSLSSLLVRILRSELTGIRNEAKAGEIVRTVGTYRNGVCLS